MSIRHNNSAALGLTIGSIATGFTPLFVRWSETAEITTAFYRMAGASLFIGLWIIARRSSSFSLVVFCKENKEKIFFCSLAGSALALDIALWNYSLHKISIGISTLLAHLAPILMTLFGFLFFKEPLTRKAKVSISMCFLGLVLLSSPNEILKDLLQKNNQSNLEQIYGVLLAFGSACGFMCYLLILKYQPLFKPQTTLFISSTSAALLLFPFAVILERTPLSPKFIPTTLNGSLVLLGLIFVSQIFGQGFITKYLSQVKTQLASIILCLPVVVAAACGFFLLGESLNTSQIIGGVFVLLSLILLK